MLPNCLSNVKFAPNIGFAAPSEAKQSSFVCKNSLKPSDSDTFCKSGHKSVAFGALVPDKLLKSAFDSGCSGYFNSKTFRDLKVILLDYRGAQKDEVVRRFSMSVDDFTSLIHKRLAELMPLEKASNAKYIDEFKIGASHVLDKATGAPVEVIFTKSGEMAKAFIDNLCVGEMRLVECKDGFLVSNMFSFDSQTYKGVGRKLHQFAVETSLAKGHEGRVFLAACDPKAKVFHYKCGFRKNGVNSQDFSKEVEAVIAGQMPSSLLGYDIMEMGLPDEEIQKIIQTQIAKSPIMPVDAAKNRKSLLGVISFITRKFAFS